MMADGESPETGLFQMAVDHEGQSGPIELSRDSYLNLLIHVKECHSKTDPRVVAHCLRLRDVKGVEVNPSPRPMRR